LIYLTGFAEILGDYFPVFHAPDMRFRLIAEELIESWLSRAPARFEILLANCGWKGPRLPQRPLPCRTVPNEPTREVGRLSILLLPP
jgi:hypothetical protein